MTNPEQPRERPKYGELAPEGWKWVPPADAANPDGLHPAADGKHGHQGQHGRSAPSGRPAPLPAPGARRPPPTWDRVVTMILLVVGLAGMLLSISVMTALPQSMQMLYDREGLGTYHQPGNLMGIMVACSICQAVLWVVAVILSVLLMRKRRRAFYVPIIAGVVAGLLLFAFISVVVLNDPALLSVMG